MIGCPLPLGQRLPAGILLLATLLLLGGCWRDFGAGGTGELSVPQSGFRQIESLEMSSLVRAEPTTRPASGPATGPGASGAQLPITIEEVRAAALANNLDLRVQLLSPSIAQQSLAEAQSRFESVFTAAVNYGKTDTPTASRLTATQDQSLVTESGIRIPLQTGGQIEFTLPVNRFETSNEFATLNPAYTSDFQASISHPLLRGAGRDASAQPIRVAFYQYQQTEARTKLEVIRILAEAERTYWRLYAARRQLEVRQKEHELALAQLDRARRQVRAGAAAEVEILRAESGVADSLQAIILAENRLRDRQRELKRILNREDLPMASPTAIVPLSQPNPVYYEIDRERLVKLALQQRMELLEAELQIALAASNVSFARNDMLPLVSLQYTYNINGLGGELQESFRMLREKDFEDHRIGLMVEVPIGNEPARSRYRRSLASRLQQIATKEARIATVKQEVLNAADQLEAAFQSILAAQKSVILAARVLDAEIRQFNLGMRTSTDVLDAQARLANAQSAEITALTDYQIAQIDIAYASGTLLGASKVVWEPIPPPRQ